ncbi:hypothetical protein [Sphaerisporangium aureirubrum]|uniref:ABC transporter permease n=1 Tax=Sphaerisporangium aureirubrum TaxID=1544736 RepID=A0ABW1ND28_9ACTN
MTDRADSATQGASPDDIPSPAAAPMSSPRVFWIRLRRDVIRVVAGGLGLLVLAMVAAVTADVLVTSRPPLDLRDGCAEHVLLDEPAYQMARCAWRSKFPFTKIPPRRVSFRVAEIGAGALRVTATLTTSRGDPAVAMVGWGDARERPNAFLEGTAGFVIIGRSSVEWTVPVLRTSAGDGYAVISMEAVHTPGKRGEPLQIEVYTSALGDVEVGTRTWSIGSVRVQDLTLAGQTGKNVTVRSTGRYGGKLDVGLVPGTPVKETYFSGPDTPEVVGFIVGGVLAALGAFGGGVLAIGVWVVVLLASRAGVFGAAGESAAWRRLEWAAGAVVVAHLVMSGVVALLVFNDRPPDIAEALRPLLEGAGLWFPEESSPSGPLILLAAAVLSLGGRWAAGPARRTTRGRLLLVVASAVVLPLYVVPAVVSGPAAQENTWPLVSGAILAAGVVVLAVLALNGAWIGAAVSRRAGGPRRRGYLGGAWLLTLTTAALAVLATYHDLGGYLPAVLRWGVLLLAGAVMVAVVARFAGNAVGAPLPRRVTLVLVPVGLAAAVPWGTLGSRSGSVGWWDLLAFGQLLNGLLVLVLVAVVAVTLRALGGDPVRSADGLREQRRVGLAAWFLVLSGGYALLDPSVAVTIPAAALGAWVLLPADQAERAVRVLGQHLAEQRAAVAWALRAGAARRTLPSMSRALREKAAESDDGFATGQARIQAVERETADAPHTVRASGRTVRVSTHQRAFGSLTSRRPWERARWGLLTGTIIGAPWILLGLGATGSIGAEEGYPVLAGVSAVAPLVLRWAGYGLLFGYFYPLLRGDTGLAKGLWFFVAAAFPALLGATVHGGGQSWNGTALLAVQLFAYAMTLGVLGDRGVLVRHGYRPGRLVDVHNLWSVTAWASSVAVAVGAGVATVIVAGLQPFLIGVVLPSPAPQPKPPAIVGQP